VWYKEIIKEEAMDKAETNGYLRAVEAQFRAVELALSELDERGHLNDKAHAVFRKVRIDLINLSAEALAIRAWNMTD
jgi:hypothetical protein